MSDTITLPRRTGDAEPVPEREAPWWRTEVDGRPVGFWVAVGLTMAAVTLGFGAWWTFGLDRGSQMAGGMAGQPATDGQMGGDEASMGAMSPDAPRVPPVFAYHDGAPIAFIHTEVSDPAIAQALEGMMGSPVPTVASLADVPEESQWVVYVFTNGLVPDNTPTGPLGFQPDVFDSAPGDDTYTPLRQIVEVTWTDESQARLLTAATDIRTAADDGTLTLEPTAVVVNAPLLTWPGGQR